MSARHGPLVEDFRRFFTVGVVTSEAQRQEIHRLRYRVYCEELRYEDASAFPDRLESDEFDVRSLHCAVIHRRSGIAAGCVRLVFAPDGPQFTPLPIEKHCAHALDPAAAGMMKHNRDSICEISRLAVDVRFRRRPGEAYSRLGERFSSLDIGHQEQRTFSLVAIAAFMAATALTELTGFHNIFAMMEACLPRMLARSGLYFDLAGQEIDYHGRRAPYFITTASALDGMAPELREFYHEIRRELVLPDGPRSAREAC